MAFNQPNQGKVSQHQFALIPRADVPRSVFKRDFTHKTTFNSGFLVPLYLDEVIPGDSINVKAGVFTRVSPNAFINPLMDNLYLDAFFFFVPSRLLWENFRRFMGERTPNTDSSTDFLVPVTSPIAGGVPVGTIGDYFGLPVQGTQVSGSIAPVALPGRAYRLIWNEWFRDQNLQNLTTVPLNDGPDSAGTYTAGLLRRGKRHDYFTSALPFAQKGQAVTIPLGTQAPVKTYDGSLVTGAQQPMSWRKDDGSNPPASSVAVGSSLGIAALTSMSVTGAGGIYPDNLYADLSQATAAHINTLRQAAAMQQYLERDARGGTRYTEKLVSHFNVHSPDARLQRPEYLGGGTSQINVNPVAQTSQTGTTPLGQLSGVGTGFGTFGCSYSAVEHGYIIGLVSVRAELTYQQGLERMWTRRTVHEYPWPSYAHLGEQVVHRKEIYCTGVPGASDDDAAFGYQPRYDEFRYKPSYITGRFRSNISGTMDSWHMSQYFSSPPVLGNTFIAEDPPLARTLAGGTLATENTMQFLCDSVFRIRHVRPLPMYGVPGLNRF